MCFHEIFILINIQIKQVEISRENLFEIEKIKHAPSEWISTHGS